MRIGITSGAYLGKEESVDGLLRMKKHGYDCMDYNFLSETDTEIYRVDDAEFVKRLTDLKKKTDSAGIEIYQTHGPWRFPPQDATKEDRAERFEKMTKAVKATALLGAKYFVIHPFMPFGWDENPDRDAFSEINFEFLSRLAEVGRENGVVICLENMPMLRLPLSNPFETLDMVKRVNSPFLRVCLDTGHSLILGVQPAAAVRKIGKEYLACLHVHDNDRSGDKHNIPFTGTTDWEDFAAALKEIGYDGVLSLETDVSYTFRLPESLKEYFEIGIADMAKFLAGIK